MNIIKLEETESTNLYAKSHINDFGDRTVIITKAQTGGRGRLNRKWIDLGDGNLFFSLILKPSAAFKSVYSNITQYASVVLCKILENYSLNAKIKWPNDVMIDGERKISGILCETVMEGKELKGIVLGIGVNLFASIENLSNVPDRVVTALNIETGLKIEPQDFLNSFLENFFGNYEEFLCVGFSYIKNDYIKRNCFLDKDISVQVLNDVKTGYVKNLTEDGALILENSKEELVLTIGDIL